MTASYGKVYMLAWTHQSVCLAFWHVPSQTLKRESSTNRLFDLSKLLPLMDLSFLTSRSVCSHSFNSRWTSILRHEECPSSISLDLQLYWPSRSQPRSISKPVFQLCYHKDPISPNSPTVESTAFLYVNLICPQHVEELRRRSWEETQNRAPAADPQGQGPYSKCFLISYTAWHWAGAGSSVWGTWDCPGLTSRSMLGKVTWHSGKLQATQ